MKNKILLVSAFIFVVILAPLLGETGGIVYLFWFGFPVLYLVINRNLKDLYIVKEKWKSALFWGVVVGVVYGILWAFAGSIYEPVVSFMYEWKSMVTEITGFSGSFYFFLGLVILVFIGDFGQEIFYRGYLQNRLVGFVGVLVAILIPALLVVWFHILEGRTIIALFNVLLLNIVAGTLFHWRKSILASIIFHALSIIVCFCLVVR